MLEVDSQTKGQIFLFVFFNFFSIEMMKALANDAVIQKCKPNFGVSF